MPTFTEHIEAFAATLTESQTGLEDFREGVMGEGQVVVDVITETRNAVGSLAIPIEAVGDQIDNVSREATAVVQAVREQSVAATNSVRDQGQVLENGFRRLVPATERPIQGPPITIEVPEPVVVVNELPAPVQDSPDPLAFGEVLQALRTQGELSTDAARAAFAPVLNTLRSVSSGVSAFVIDTQAQLNPFRESIANLTPTPAVEGIPLPREIPNIDFSEVRGWAGRRRLLEDYKWHFVTTAAGALKDVFGGVVDSDVAGRGAMQFDRGGSFEGVPGLQFIPQETMDQVRLTPPQRRAQFVAESVAVAGQLNQVRETMRKNEEAEAKLRDRLVGGAVKGFRTAQKEAERAQQRMRRSFQSAYKPIREFYKQTANMAEDVAKSLRGQTIINPFRATEFTTDPLFLRPRDPAPESVSLESFRKVGAQPAERESATLGLPRTGTPDRPTATDLGGRVIKAYPPEPAPSTEGISATPPAVSVDMRDFAGPQQVPTFNQLPFMGAAGIHDAARERERREAFQAEKRELKRQYQLGQMNRAVYQQRRLELEEDFRAQQEFQTNNEVFREGVAQIAENINTAGLQFSESIQKAAPGLTQFFDQDLRDVLTSAFQVEAVFDLSEYLEPFKEEMEGITNELVRFMRSMDQTAALTNLLGNVFKKSGGSVERWEAQLGGYAAVFSGIVSSMAQGGGFLGGFGTGFGGIAGLALGGGSPQAGMLGTSIGESIGSALQDALTGRDDREAAAQEAMDPAMGEGTGRVTVRTTHNHIGQIVNEIDAVLTDRNPDIEGLMDEIGQRMEQRLEALSV